MTSCCSEPPGGALGDASQQVPEGTPDDFGLRGPLLLEERVILTAPDGFGLTPPPDVDDDRGFARYRATYAVNDGVLEAMRTLEIRENRLEPEQRAQVSLFVRTLQQDLARGVAVRASAPDAD